MKTLLWIWIPVAITGILLMQIFSWGGKPVLWGHILGGFLFTVFFGLVIPDHLKANQSKWWKRDRDFITGATALIVIVLNILSGFVLYLYGGEPMEFWTECHLYTTILTVFLVIAHLIGKNKRKKGYDRKC